MALGYDPAENHPWVREVLRAAAIPQASVDLRIDADDEMLLHGWAETGDRDSALAAYFASGIEIASALDQVVLGLFGGYHRLGRVLDFGSGYGRVARFLAPRLSSRLWVSDLLPGALAALEKRLDARPLPSTNEPHDLRCRERFDLIYVGSLFTHLPDRTFGQWLDRLAGLLTPAGVLVFTVHDHSLRPPHLEMPAAGLCFEAASESRSIDHDQYGSAWVTEDYVQRQVAALGGFAVRQIARGLCHYQDLVLLTAVPGRDLASLRFDPGPDVRIDRCELTNDGNLALSGWAIGRLPGSEPATIEVALDGEVRAIVDDFEPRPDIFQSLAEIGLPPSRIAEDRLDSDLLLRSGWSCSVPLPAPHRLSHTILQIRATSRAGTRRTAFTGSLAQALHHAAAENYRHEYNRVFELEKTIGEMERDGFWKLRQRWFQLKRFAGLTEETGRAL